MTNNYFLSTTILIVTIKLIVTENHLGCGQGTKLCSNGFCYPIKKECNFIDDCGDNSDEESCPSVCNFNGDNNLCGWSDQGFGSSPFFTVINPNDTNANYPAIDWIGRKVTDGNKFLILTPHPNSENLLPTEFKSKSMTKSNSNCKFIFYIHTNDTFTSVRVIKTSTDSKIKWTAKELAKNDHLNHWTKVKIDTDDIDVGQRFQISFESELYQHSHVAIGGIEFTNCGLNPDKDFPPCKRSSDFQCKSDGKCIDENLECNWDQDCDDNSDEIHCPKKCSFNESFCNWLNVDEFDTSDPYDWTLPTVDGPEKDSSGVSIKDGGRYLMVSKRNITTNPTISSGDSDLKYEKVAVLMSPSPGYMPLYHQCRLEFQMYDKNDALNVSIAFKGEDGKLNRIIEVQESDTDIGSGVIEGWTKVFVPIPQYKRVSIWFYGTYKKDGILAIDDFNFKYCDKNPAPVTMAPVTDVPGATDGSDVVPIPDTTDGSDVDPISDSTDGPLPTGDPVVIIPGDEECPRPSIECMVEGRKKCLPKSAICNLVTECDDYKDEQGCTAMNCDFSKDTCGWTIDGGWSSVSQRELVRTESGNKDLYPKKSDNYDERFLFLDPVLELVADNNPVMVYDNGRKTRTVASTYLHRLNSNCYISFKYYCHIEKCPLQIVTEKLFEFDNGTINNEISGSIWEPLDGQLFDQSELTNANWMTGKAFIGQSDAIKITFQAVDMNSEQSKLNYVIGLDEIKFTDCTSAINVDPSVNCDPATEFKCETSFECIDVSKVCDLVQDCLDGSDESDSGKSNCSNRIGQCHFEDGCDFWVKNSGHDWLHEKGINGQLMTDHTIRLPQGTYLSLRRNQFNRNWYGNIASTISSPYFDSAKSKLCQLRFWYNIIDGHSVNKLIIRRLYKNMIESEIIDTIKVDSKIDFWNKYSTNIYNQYNDTDFQIIIEAMVDKYSKGSVNIDDITMSDNCYIADGEIISTNCNQDEYMCVNGRCYQHRQRCNFYDDCGDGTDELECPSMCDFTDGTFCSWISVPGNSGRWFHNDNDTVPMVDSRGLSFDNGGRFIVSTINRDIGSLYSDGDEDKIISVLKSASYSNSASMCKINFAHWTPKFSSLIVQINNLKEKRVQPLFELDNFDSDIDGVDWKNYSTILPFAGDPFEVSIIGTIYNSTLFNASIIAIDNIRFTDCASCHSDEHRCADGSACIKKGQLCDGIFDCDDGSDENDCKPTIGSCYFDHHAEWLDTDCKWSHDKLYDFKWTISNQINEKSGPQSLLMKSKYFLIANSVGKRTGDKCGIKTIKMPTTKSTDCSMSFYYYMYSEDALNMGALRIFQESVSDGKIIELFHKKGDQGQQWLHQRISLDQSMDTDYVVMFEATIGTPGTSNIAIDRVKFSPQCAPGQELKPTSPTIEKVDDDEPNPVLAIIMLIVGIISILAVGGFIFYKLYKKHGIKFFWKKDGGHGLIDNEIPMGLTNPIYDDQIKDLQQSMSSSRTSSSVAKVSTDNNDLLMSSSASSWKHQDGDNINDAIKDLEEIVLN